MAGSAIAGGVERNAAAHHDSAEEKISAGHGFMKQNVAAAIVCLAWNAIYLWLALELPAGHSRGDAGPGALPILIAGFGILVSLVYLLQAVRGKGLSGSEGVADPLRVLAMLALFSAVALLASTVGLAIALAVASGLGTCLFAGDKRLLRALLTGGGMWAIAYFLFTRLLGLPLP